MAPYKRSRDSDDVDDEVEVDGSTGSAGFSSRHDVRLKRPRVTLARENGRSVVSDGGNESDTVGSSGDDNGRDDSLTRDLGEQEEENDEIDELEATQIVEKQIREHESRGRDNMASEQGVIEEVFCRNFMCHSKLRMALGPNINFIIGHNGSGKSAVLTALTMCLGGKATATNRGASLKSLIKEGEESGTLAVKIKNQGDGAYKPELYGRSITVERHFSRAGANGFKLKNEQDRVVSTKKSDLDDVLDFYAFQLDNPINVLTQDLARQFLANSSPADKYKFFIRGTQLELLDADYRLMEEHLDNIEAKLQSRENDIGVLKAKSDEAERRKKRLDRSAAIEQKIRETQYMHAWAQVEEQERLLENYEQQVRDALGQVEEQKAAAEAAGAIYEGHNQAYVAAQRTLSDFEEQAIPVKDNHGSEKEKFDANKNELLSLVTEERTIRSNLKTHKAVAKKIESQLEEEQIRLANAEGPGHVERLARLEQLKEEAVEAKNQQMAHGTSIADLQRKKSETAQQVDAGKSTLIQERESLGRAENLLQRLRDDQPRQFAAFRQHMDHLVKAVNNETRWRSKPVGPMGLHIKLLKPEWGSQIERTFGGVLESFIVTCKEDEILLSQMMKKFNCTPGVFIGDPRPLDTSGKEPHGDVDTIMRVLDIDDHSVRNSLIINQAIDQTVLISDRQEANRYMYNSARPQNVRATICFGPDRGTGIRFEYTKTGGRKSSPVSKWEGQSRMKSDRESQLRIQRENVNQVKREVDLTQQKVRQLELAHKAANEEMKRFQNVQRNLTTKFQEAEDAVEAQQNEIDNNRPQHGKLQELERQLADAKDDVNSSENSFGDMVIAKDKLNEVQQALKPALDAAQAELDQATRNVERAGKRVEQSGRARTTALHEKNLALQRVEDQKKTQVQTEEKRDKQVERLQTIFYTKANEICSRVPVDSGITCADLDKRLDRFVEDFHQIQREAGGSREELTLAFKKARKEYLDAIGQVRGMIDCSKELKQSLIQRHHRWHMFRKYISFRARFTFSYLLSERQFRGRLIIDHEGKELDTKVEPDLSKSSDAGRQTKTLSGGEKSFSTICLLLSIWEAMGSPIRCLDEFDVFMDSVNRATSMTMMIQAARRAVGRQFILITPQSMNNVNLGDDVKIIKMSDPERGQQTLSY